MFTPTKPKTKSNRMVIRVTKVASGHQAHTTGTGAHYDKRTKRHRTRGTKSRAALSEWA